MNGFTKEEIKKMTPVKRQNNNVLLCEPVKIEIEQKTGGTLKILEVFTEDVDEWKKQYIVDYNNQNYEPYYSKSTFDLLNRFPFEDHNIRAVIGGSRPVYTTDRDKKTGDITYQLGQDSIDRINKKLDISEMNSKFNNMIKDLFRKKEELNGITKYRQDKMLCTCGCVIVRKGESKHSGTKKCSAGRKKYRESIKIREVPDFLKDDSVEVETIKEVVKPVPVEPIKYVQITEEQYAEYMALKQKFN